MEDELEDEGLDEEVGEPQKPKGKGSPLKMIIILGAMFVIAVVLVFFGPLKFILGSEPEEGEEEMVVPEIFDTEYGFEHILPEIVHTMLDERGRVKNLVINAIFETTPKIANELTLRVGLAQDIVKNQFSKYDFKQILDPAMQDTLQIRIRDDLNMHLPIDKNNMIRRVFLQIVTM